jgi:hypothetical protein
MIGLVKHNVFPMAVRHGEAELVRPLVSLGLVWDNWRSVLINLNFAILM